MKTRHIVIACVFLFASGKMEAQSFSRILGGRGFDIDDGTRSGKTVRLDAGSALSASYALHFPNDPPSSGQNFLGVDANGNMNWTSSVTPSLPQGNIWIGDVNNVATPLAPGAIGTILGIDAATGMPVWMQYNPSTTTVTANQITTGTVQPGQVIAVGDGAIIAPSGNGLIVANQLTGSGPNKYSGSIPIPQNEMSMNVNYAGVTAGSTVLVSIIDAAGQTAQVSVSQVTPGVGFNVIFSGYYPTTTGSLNYLVIN